jgi:hypothetical protein
MALSSGPLFSPGGLAREIAERREREGERDGGGGLARAHERFRVLDTALTATAPALMRQLRAFLAEVSLRFGLRVEGSAYKPSKTMGSCGS